MTKEPFIAHSDLTNEIYIVCGSRKYLVTEQVIKAMQNTGRLEQQSCDDCVSRAEVLQMIEDIQNAGGFIGYNTYSEAFDQVDNMPPVTPIHGTCKYCRRYNRSEMFCTYHGGYLMQKCDPDYYCWDFERRESNNDNT